MIIWGITGAVAAFVAHRLIGPYFDPSNYRNDWYGWLTNQIGHAAAMAVALLVICLSFHANGYGYPWKADLIALGVMFSGVFQFMQWRVGGGFWDSVEDAVFMGVYGWAALVFCFDVSPRETAQIIEGHAAAWAVVFCGHLVSGVAFRWVR